MRGRTPTIHCDAEDGSCGAWDVDYYTAAVDSVDGVKVTRERRAPGWLSTDEDDFCSDHHPSLDGSEEQTTTTTTVTTVAASTGGQVLCWCGDERGPRVPADADGLGCLADISHANPTTAAQGSHAG